MTREYEYTPKRANKTRWLKGAPPYVLDCFDHGEKWPNDRYEIIFDKTLASVTGSYAETWISFVSITENGYYSSHEMPAYDMAQYRYRNGKRRVSWESLPDKVKSAAIYWAEIL